MVRRKFKETVTWTFYFWYIPPRSIRYSNILWTQKDIYYGGKHMAYVWKTLLLHILLLPNL